MAVRRVGKRSAIYPEAVAKHYRVTDRVRRANPNLFGPGAAPYLDAAGRLRELARSMGQPLEQVAVNWLAAQPGIGPVIAGAETAAQVEATAAAGSWELTPEELAAITDAATARG